jgi:hypothetical protein
MTDTAPKQPVTIGNSPITAQHGNNCKMGPKTTQNSSNTAINNLKQPRNSLKQPIAARNGTQMALTWPETTPKWSENKTKRSLKDPKHETERAPKRPETSMKWLNMTLRTG